MQLQPKTYKWFISLLLLAWVLPLSAQQLQTTDDRLKKSVEPQKQDKPQKEKVFFERNLKLGWDISNLLIGAISPKRYGLDLYADVTVAKNTYLALEFGNNTYSETSTLMEYGSKGNYFRIGMDFDLRKDKQGSNRDMFYLGVRYAYARFEQSLSNYQISSDLWPLVTEENITFSNQAHWVETIAGFKVEVFKNIYLGLGMRFKLLVYQAGDKTIKRAPYIPGYGKTSSSLIAGFNYTLYYNLPLNYSKKNLSREKN